MASETEVRAFDFVVANPPFSHKAWGSGLTRANGYGRFSLGMPPEKNGDYGFLLHAITSLKSTGSGAVILPHGVLFRNKEAEIREKILKQGYIKGIIGLPTNLFYGTGIPAAIIVLDKSAASADRPVFMIDASRGFVKDGNKNRLRERDIHKITDVFSPQIEMPGYSRLVPFAEIRRNDFDLNIPRYIDGSEPEDIQDIEAHLKGGVPDRDLDLLGDFWAVMPGVRSALSDRTRERATPHRLSSPGRFEPHQFQITLSSTTFRERIHTILDGWAGLPPSGPV